SCRQIMRTRSEIESRLERPTRRRTRSIRSTRTGRARRALVISRRAPPSPRETAIRRAEHERDARHPRRASIVESSGNKGRRMSAESDRNGREPNRLSRETSPYLLQHALNPVDWYPWGEEAFRHARDRDVPIFLSVGYSSCHWCHVMERES